MEARYEVLTDVGIYPFESQNDAITAFIMHTDYTLISGGHLDPEEIRTALEKKGEFKSYPSSIRVREE